MQIVTKNEQGGILTSVKINFNGKTSQETKTLYIKKDSIHQEYITIINI